MEKRKRNTSKQKKNQKNQKPITNTKTGWQMWWQHKRPIIGFGLLFAFFVTLFYALFHVDFFENNLHPPFLQLNANLAGWGLNLLGQQVTVANSVISSNVFSIDIHQNCDGLTPIGLFAAAILAYPADWRHKMAGIVVAILLLIPINIIRIATLFLTGVYYEPLFEVMHLDIWPFAIVLMATVLCFLWIQWTHYKSKAV